MPTFQLSKSAATLAARFILLTTILLTAILLPNLAAAQIVGSGNTAFIEAPVVVPKTTPCKVELYSNFKFNNFNPQSFTYTPPAGCPAPWGAVVLSADFSISVDRTRVAAGSRMSRNC